MADQSGRDYRKGNWTVSETMVLIEAKRMDDERRMKSSEGIRSKPTELRWKWVEDYCWRKGCLRSQNQCNDKWDNLMRDYKKVRDYERKILIEDGSSSSYSSYWKLQKNERKEKNLPSNMLSEVYQALVDVVEKKGPQNLTTIAFSAAAGAGACAVGGGSGGGTTSCYQNITYVHQQSSSSIPVQIPILPLPPQPPPLPPPLLCSDQPLPAVDSDTNEEYSDSPAKRRRSGRNGGGSASSGICKSASIIAEAMEASEERKERRHRDLLSIRERRLKIEESKAEINRKGINGLVDAINNLANSILALASQKHHSTPK